LRKYSLELLLLEFGIALSSQCCLQHYKFSPNQRRMLQEWKSIALQVARVLDNSLLYLSAKSLPSTAFDACFITELF
jgi:hypothetical protein